MDADPIGETGVTIGRRIDKMARWTRGGHVRVAFGPVCVSLEETRRTRKRHMTVIYFVRVSHPSRVFINRPAVGRLSTDNGPDCPPLGKERDLKGSHRGDRRLLLSHSDGRTDGRSIYIIESPRRG